MEINYIITGKFETTTGPIGPIEIQIVYFIMFSAAGYFGVSGMGEPVSSLAPYLSESWHLNHLISLFWLTLICMFLFQNIFSSLRKDFGKTIHYIVPFMIVALTFYAES